MVIRISKKSQFERLLHSRENPNTKIAYISQYDQKIRFLENSIFSERCIALCWYFQNILGTMRHIYTRIFRFEFSCLLGETVGGFWDFFGIFRDFKSEKIRFSPLACNEWCWLKVFSFSFFLILIRLFLWQSTVH